MTAKCETCNGTKKVYGFGGIVKPCACTTVAEKPKKVMGRPKKQSKEG